jgi:D-glycero-alpha-D-manno-heptose-7-phosphate kinase
MIISRTPLRISFVGGGSDLPAFYEREPGAVVSTTINRYVYITVNPKFDRRIRASYSQTETVDRVDDLKHELIRESLRITGIDGAIEITSISDIPSRGTGLGSSSAYTVGLLNALYAHTGRLAGAERLASEACAIEIDRCGRPIGKQDQYSAAYGGLKYLTFNPDGTVFVEQILCGKAARRQLESSLLLFYTGQTRRAESILEEQSRNSADHDATRAALRRMVELAGELRDALNRSDIGGFGEVLHANWAHKRHLASGISTPTLDGWYDTARAHGAVGGKVLGAGGGGFLLLCAPAARHPEICAALPALRRVPFHFEAQGSRLIYVEENGYPGEPLGL